MLMLKEKMIMINNMEDTAKIFMVGLKKWAKIHKINQTKLGSIINRDQTTISLYYQGVTRPTPEMITLWINHFDLDYEEILETGRKENQPHNTDEIKQLVKDAIAEQTQPSNIVTFKSKIEQEHFALIQSFENPSKALEANHLLVELEKLDIEAYYAMIGQIEGRVAKIKSEKNKAKHRQEKKKQA